MKIIWVIAILLFSVLFSKAQVTPEAFIGLIPGLPNNACRLTESQRNEYLQKVSDVEDQINEVIEKKNEEANVKAEEIEKLTKKNFSSQYGLSEANVEKLNNSADLSEKDEEALIDKAMQEKLNMSYDESKALSKMSESGQEAWGQAYAAEQTATGMADSEKTKTDMQKNMTVVELAKEQDLLIKKLNSPAKQKIADLANEEAALRAKLDTALRPLYEELYKINDGEGATETDLKHRGKVLKEIELQQLIYCDALTPKYYDIMEKWLSKIKSDLPDYYRLEMVSSEMTKRSTGVNKESGSQGLLALQALRDYIYELNSAFKFALAKFYD